MLDGLLLCDDLMFQSRITGTARALGLKLQAVSSAPALLDLAEKERPAGVILDLANPTLDIDSLLARLSAGATRPFVVAYGSHVDVETLRRARAAGCQEVLPRSKFVEELPAKLKEWLTTNGERGASAPDPLV